MGACREGRWLSRLRWRQQSRRLCSSAPMHRGPVKRPLKPFHVPPTYEICGRSWETDEWSNLTTRVLSAIGARLPSRPGHPLCLLKQRILHHFHQNHPSQSPGSRSPLFSLHEIPDPVVSVEANFDRLFVPKDHVSRTKTDTYYVNSGHLLRGHTSAHQHELIRSGLDAFLLLGDVYRRDQVDNTHYPIFHQMEGLRLFSPHQLGQAFRAQEPVPLFDPSHESRSGERQEGHSTEASLLLTQSLQTTLEGLARELLGEEAELRWVDAFFPFTHPSWELEVRDPSGGDWVEMLGCGLIEQKLLRAAGAGEKVGWAFGLGLERWAMALYGIPDIRLFWSQDPAFLRQFPPDGDFARRIVFEPIGKFPPLHNDVSFWLPDSGKPEPNDVAELVREAAGEVAEHVELIDSFLHPKKQKTSVCYRILYRHPTKKISQADVDVLHQRVREELVSHYGVQGRWDQDSPSE